MRIQSTPITFIDQTDSRKLEVYIKSNLPTTQIYNSNTGAFTPDWTKNEGLKLEADVFLDSRKLEESYSSTYSVKWYKEDVVVANNINTINIKENMSDSNPITTYIFEVTYQEITASSRITFTRVDTGLDGDGKAGRGIESITEHYLASSSASGVTVATAGWTETPQTIDSSKRYLWNYETILYTDGASDSKDPIIIGTYGRDGIAGDKGADGRGIKSIKEYYLASIASSGVTTATSGWKDTMQPITSTNKYLWNYELITYTDNNTETTIPVIIGVYGDKGDQGVQGPKGNDGQQYYTWIKYADTPTSGMSNDPTGKTYIGLAYNKTSATESNTYSDYMWSLIKGETGPTGPKGDDGQQYYTWIKYADNASGANMSDSPTGKLYIGLAYNKTTSTESNTASDYTWALFKGDKGDKGDTGSAGRGISSIVEQYYQSTSATSQAGGSWSATAPTWADGKYIWTRSVITYTDATTYTTPPVCVTGQKGGTGGTGAAGVGVSSIDVWYYHSTSATALSGGSWSTTAPTWSDGKYVWTKTITTYTNSTTDETAAVCITGQKGSTGVGIKSVTENYLATASSSGVTISTTGWTTTIQTITADKKYLWNYEIITYTDNTTSTTNPIIIGVFGNTGSTGAAGKGIKSITEYYLATTASSGVTTSTANWTTTMQTLTATNKYLWNYEVITYTDNSTATINPVIIGVYGDRGATGAAGTDAYTVILTNESHVFAGNISSAVASSAATQVLAYKGTAAQTVTIVSINGVAAATASTATGIAGLSFACSALSGTSPTITFTCTTSFVSPSGTIPIVLSVGGVSITKMFTYSIAFKGATGAQGSTGAASSSYWLVSNASTVQKTANGDVLFTPATLTFTGKIKTGSGAPTDYACRWILAYSTDGTTYTNAYTSTANEATASIAASDTYKSVRARMYLAGGTTTLLDEQIIPFVSDGETGAIGAPGDPGVTFQVYSNNGYALSTAIPTILLQTFAYLGDVEITAGATFQWYRHNGTDWVAISGATNAYFNVSRDDVSFSNNYQCKMQFNGTEYVGVVTIEDKNDENKVFASKPSNYFAGDLWIVGTDYAPSGYAVGTMLRAEHTNTSYTDSDWVPATKYDEEIENLKSTVDSYKQYFSVNSTNGLQIGNSSINNDILTTDTVNALAVNADSASFESLDVTGRYSGSTILQAPIINLGTFSMVIESNGSLSIVANT